MSFFPQYFRLSSNSKRSYQFWVEGFAQLIAQVFGSNSSRPMFQDFDNASAGNMAPFGSVIANGGTLTDSSAFVDNITQAVGVAAIATGTVSAAGSSALRTSLSLLTLGNRAQVFQARLTGSTSTGAQEYALTVGFASNLNNVVLNAVNCCCFRYNREVDGAKWTCITAKDSNADPAAPTNTTKFVTTVDFDPNDMHVFKIDVDTNGVATFFIDDAQVHQTSTNVPTDPAGFAHQVGIGTRVLKLAGTGTSRTAYVDFMGLVSS